MRRTSTGVSCWLDDLGSVSYLDRLDTASASALYRDALIALVRIQDQGPGRCGAAL